LALAALFILRRKKKRKKKQIPRYARNDITFSLYASDDLLYIGG